MTKKDTVKDRLALFRQWMRAENLDAFLLNTHDEYLAEEAPAHAMRLAWLTGFSGSLGEALIGQEEAYFFADGRYTTQAQEELPAELFTIYEPVRTSCGAVLTQILQEGQRVGIYPWSSSVASYKRLEDVVRQKGATFVLVTPHPVDKLWTEKPAPQLYPIKPHPFLYSGKDHREKIEDLRQEMTKKGLDVYITCAPEAVSWLLNIRGKDCGRVPTPAVYALIPAEGPIEVFAHPRSNDPDLHDHLGSDIILKSRETFEARLQDLAEANLLTIGFDPAETPYAIEQALTGKNATVQPCENLLSGPRARKNPTEVEGARLTHLHDGLALVRGLYWIEKNQGHIDELDVAEKLLEERKKSPLFQMVSFHSISAFGAHAAMAHYRPYTHESASKLKKDGIFLIDSGGHYLTGTTDVTRTLIIGTPTTEQKDRFTRVLRGHIALARCVFPVGTRGWQLDVLARFNLWQVGLDYSHATGHGVGSYLNVHEDPVYIGASARISFPFGPGIIVSNEPGYYKPGSFGIRIESLLVIVPCENLIDEITGQPMLQFETLTLAPIDKRLIDKAMLTAEEVDWLDTYHHHVYEALAPHLEEDVRGWLYDATRPL